MNPLVIKVCGITNTEDGLLAAEAGADVLGFVFWPGSPRHVSLEKAREISRALPPHVLRAGVFVDASAEEMARCADEVGLDLLQLHGAEPPEAVARAPRRVLKALHVGEGFAHGEALRYSAVSFGLLVDTRLPVGLPGGTGQAFDWSLVAGLARRVPFLMLAGGLSPTNVAEAVRVVRPHGIDVSSAVEASPGRKDPAKVRAFVEAARAAEGVAA